MARTIGALLGYPDVASIWGDARVMRLGRCCDMIQFLRSARNIRSDWGELFDGNLVDLLGDEQRLRCPSSGGNAAWVSGDALMCHDLCLLR